MTMAMSAADRAPYGQQHEQPMQRHAERDAAPDQPSGDVGADSIQAAMRKVDDPHDPEDQAQARGNEEKHGGVEQRVQDLDGENRHRSPSLGANAADARRDARLRRPSATRGSSDTAGRVFTEGRNTAFRQLSPMKTNRARWFGRGGL